MQRSLLLIGIIRASHSIVRALSIQWQILRRYLARHIYQLIDISIEFTRYILLGRLLSGMSLEETVDYLAEELDLERSDHVREVGQSVAELRDYTKQLSALLKSSVEDRFGRLC